MILAGEHALQPPEPTAAEVREGVDVVAKKIASVNKKYFQDDYMSTRFHGSEAVHGPTYRLAKEL
jgi:hypothetical protein